MEIKTHKFVQCAVLATLCFITPTYLQIRVSVPGGDFTSIHFSSVFLVLTVLLLGGLYDGLAGAIGMTITDVMDPVYILAAPKTFVLKLYIGLIVGAIAHKSKKVNGSNDNKYILKWAAIVSCARMLFNVFADPFVGCFYKLYVLGQPQQIVSALAKINAGVTFSNAIVTAIVANILYMAVRSVLKRPHLLD